MATVKEFILKDDLRDDGTWNVKIRITHNRKNAYIKTPHYVTSKQIKKDFTLKDPFIIDQVSPVVAEFRKQISSMAYRIDLMTARQIADELARPKDGGGINFTQFCEEHIAKLRLQGKNGSADNMRAVLNGLGDYFASPSIQINEINSANLQKIETHIRTPRIITRKGNKGQDVKIKLKGSSDAGVHNFMRDLRILFNAARDKFNDEDAGIMRIPHYPFRKYKVGDAPAAPRRNRPTNVIKAVRDSVVAPGCRAELARDLAMLSFYLCGMNAVDMFNYLDSKYISAGRIAYNRSKTTTRRKDKAFISIKIPDVAKPIVEKYAGKLQKRYATHKELNAALNKGLKQVGAALEIDGQLQPINDLEFYDFRHSFGNEARNTCRFSKDDVALAMNHVDQARKTTDVYIAPSWDIVDEVQAGVLKLLD